MANNIQFEWEGLGNFMSDLTLMAADMQNEIEKGMEEISLEVETGARALAHRYGGTLEQSIVAAGVAFQNGIFITSVGTNLVYAWKLHERVPKPGERDLHDNGITIRGYYVNGLGQRTRNKGQWRGQMPGRKFLERAVDELEDDFYDIMNEVYDRILHRWGNGT